MKRTETRFYHSPAHCDCSVATSGHLLPTTTLANVAEKIRHAGGKDAISSTERGASGGHARKSNDCDDKRGR